MTQTNLEQFVLDVVSFPEERLTALEKGEIARFGTPIARAAFGLPNMSEQEVVDHAINGLSTGVYARTLDGGKLVGFAGSVCEVIAGKRVIYVKGVAIDPNYQGRKLYNFFSPLRLFNDVDELMIAQKETVVPYVCTRSQSPRVFKMFSQKLGLHPQVGKETPEELRQLAKTCARYVQDNHSRPLPNFEFDENHFVVRGAYGGPMYPNGLPRVDDAGIQQFVESNLDLSKGDAFFLFGVFDRNKCRELLNTAVNENPEYVITYRPRIVST